MNEHGEAEVFKHGYACKDDPHSRVEAAVALYIRKPIGLKWHVEQEHHELLAAIKKLPREHRAKVYPKFAKRPPYRCQAAA